jgi:hypothetical protein
VDLNQDTSQSLLIAGTHRSGSTWLANLINSQLHYRFIFEPVRHAKDTTFSAYNRRYVQPSSEDIDLRQQFERLLSGQEQNYHLNRKNQHLFCHGRLLKDVSINLLLKWVSQEFSSVPIIYIIRNPFLVVTSCLKMNWLLAKEPEFWLNQEALMAEHLRAYRRLIHHSKTVVEKFTLEWCILNFVPLRQFGQDEWKLVFYDELVRNPEQEIESIFAYLKMPYKRSILKKIATPSHTAEEEVKDRRQLLDKWKTALLPQEQKTIEYYACEFGLNRYLTTTNEGRSE